MANIRRVAVPVWATFISPPDRFEVGPDDSFEVGSSYRMSRASLARWVSLGRAREATEDEIAAAAAALLPSSLAPEPPVDDAPPVEGDLPLGPDGPDGIPTAGPSLSPIASPRTMRHAGRGKYHVYAGPARLTVFPVDKADAEEMIAAA